MDKRARCPIKVLIWLGLPAALAACAAPRATPVQPVQAPAMGGTTTVGTIIAVRSISPGVGQSGIQPGLSDVMAALQEPMPKLPFTAQEFVIQCSDGDPVSIVTRSQTAGGLAAGDEVAIVKSTQTGLFPRD